jgi:hypothetical protein
MPHLKPWTPHPEYVEAMLDRPRAAVRRVTGAVEEGWQQANAGAIPAGRDAAALAAGSGLSHFMIRDVELFITLHKEIVTLVNESVLLEPLAPSGRRFVREELRRAVKAVERSAGDILKSLGGPSR